MSDKNKPPYTFSTHIGAPLTKQFGTFLPRRPHYRFGDLFGQGITLADRFTGISELLHKFQQCRPKSLHLARLLLNLVVSCVSKPLVVEATLKSNDQDTEAFTGASHPCADLFRGGAFRLIQSPAVLQLFPGNSYHIAVLSSALKGSRALRRFICN